MNLSRTWMLRGVVGVFLAVMSGAWALSLAVTGGPAEPSAQSARDEVTPADTATGDVPEEAPPLLDDDTTPSADATQTASESTTADADATGVVPVVGATSPTTAPTTSGPRTPAGSPSPSKPAPGKPTKKPTKTPTPTPSQPSSPSPSSPPRNECTDLVSGLNCVLAPITKRP